jgi:hypothetical protein
VTWPLTPRRRDTDRSGMRRFVLLAVLSAVVAAPAGAGDVRMLRVPDVKLSFAVPKSWVTVDAREVASAAGNELRRENPELASILDAMARPGSPVRLLAFDPATLGGFLTNVNVVVTRVPRGLDLAEYQRLSTAELRRLPGLVGSPSVRVVTLRAGRAVRTHVRAAVVVHGRRVVADINQFAFLRGGRSIVITFTSGVAAARKTAPTIARTAASIRLG